VRGVLAEEDPDPGRPTTGSDVVLVRARSLAVDGVAAVKIERGPRAPCWTVDEDEILAAHYTRLGPLGLLPYLPGRSREAVAQRACRQGLSSTRGPRRVVEAEEAAEAAPVVAPVLVRRLPSPMPLVLETITIDARDPTRGLRWSL
jgi:hypothetical protein